MREARLIPPLGDCYPPRGPLEIAAYCEEDVLQGYMEFTRGEDAPGDNHAPGYRWGWINARRDVTKAPDGFDHLRSAFLALGTEVRP